MTDSEDKCRECGLTQDRCDAILGCCINCTHAGSGPAYPALRRRVIPRSDRTFSVGLEVTATAGDIYCFTPEINTQTRFERLFIDSVSAPFFMVNYELPEQTVMRGAFCGSWFAVTDGRTLPDILVYPGQKVRITFRNLDSQPRLLLAVFTGRELR